MSRKRGGEVAATQLAEVSKHTLLHSECADLADKVQRVCKMHAARGSEGRGGRAPATHP